MNNQIGIALIIVGCFIGIIIVSLINRFFDNSKYNDLLKSKGKLMYKLSKENKRLAREIENNCDGYYQMFISEEDRYESKKELVDCGIQEEME